MYIIAIAWIYVTLLMAFTETSVIVGIVSFMFYGFFPVALILWLGGTRARRRKRAEPTAPLEKGSTK